MKIVVIARQDARVKKFSAILRFFTQFGFIVFTYLYSKRLEAGLFYHTKNKVQSLSFAPLPNPLLRGEGKGITFNTGEVYQRGFISNWTKIFTVIASEGKQSQPWELLHFTALYMANATLR
ncbi:hypothetical protein [Dolichospermum heterosporum]|uniref:Uncharacterized protein n=1 Tax=Dolichospermum heterosporum TAC447 TaxID=747523 RepID=A0ABY5M0P5_9CYAN|nr:hypothetical protein [Dolichospermum heterosporum]UUO16351.1 hypothetical protein NG743_04695 [Dolichospermum heterosporum TAC447]